MCAVAGILTSMVDDETGDGGWTPLLEISRATHTWLGLGGPARSTWQVARSSEGSGTSLAGASWVAAWPLLERDVDATAEELQRRTTALGAPEFPWVDVVVSAMRSGMDYWAELGMARAEVLPRDPAIQAAAEELQTARWASQHVRHRARKLSRG
jgi:hypothetical protein